MTYINAKIFKLVVLLSTTHRTADVIETFPITPQRCSPLTTGFYLTKYPASVMMSTLCCHADLSWFVLNVYLASQIAWSELFVVQQRVIEIVNSTHYLRWVHAQESQLWSSFWLFAIWAEQVRHVIQLTEGVLPEERMTSDGDRLS